MDTKTFQAVLDEALSAGTEAARKCRPTPMIVQAVNLYDVPLPESKPEVVMGGVCGFAWVKLRPANSAFAKWLMVNGGFSKAYDGGCDYWVSVGNQSMEIKEAFANAMAEVLRKYGFNAYAYSRMD